MSYVEIPEILLPNKNIDYSRWSVIACDQFTSQVDYWEDVKEQVNGSKSTLNLIFPEAYLKNSNKNEAINKINSTMHEYLNSDTFYSVNNFVFVDREIYKGVHRYGLMVAIDLEAYDYAPKSPLAIKATERVVPERLPIRIEIRKDAPIELPHIILLMDDVKNKIFNSIKNDPNNLKKLYDFDLMKNGGNIKGFEVLNSQKIKEDILSLCSKDHMKDRYNVDEGEILFVVGDGNHSLATAKECWNNVKKNLSSKERENHPARFALCELQNLHDEAILFEPIHRVIFNTDENFINYLKDNMQGEGKLNVFYNGQDYILSVDKDPTKAIAQIQTAIDNYLSEHKEAEIDYIHGDEYTLEIANKNNAVAIFMPKINKESLFDYVLKNGVMPRKSFSIGDAENKRYYFECHKVCK